MDARNWAEYMVGQSISAECRRRALLGNGCFTNIALRLAAGPGETGLPIRSPHARLVSKPLAACSEIDLTRTDMCSSHARKWGLTMAIHSLAGDAVIGLDASSAVGGEARTCELTPGPENCGELDGSQGVMGFTPMRSVSLFMSRDRAAPGDPDELDIPPLTELMTITEAT